MLLKTLVLVAALLCATPLHAYDPLTYPAVIPPEPRDLAVQDATREREIPLRVYLPGKSGAAPVVLFSHGLGGTRKGSAFLGKHWAARGYVAVFLQHPGSDDSVWRDKPPAERFAALSEAASLGNFLARVRDVSAVLDQLEKWNGESGHELAGRLDLKRIGMSGHSFGAVTTQAVSGQKFSAGAAMTDPRIKAAIAFSPSKPAVGDVATAFGSVAIPWLLMTGTEDVARLGSRTIGPADVASRLAVFPALPAGDKYELVLEGADHFAFTDRGEFAGESPRNPNHYRVILALSTAFWDAFLRDDAAAKTWLNSESPRQLMEEKDRWQRK
jgi:predicted dienelactone hydrolase